MAWASSTDVLSIIAGLGLLIAGAELLVRGAVDAAARIGLSTLFIGLVLVSLATSAPELVTSVQAALRDSPGIAIGNIVGSNIANILLILGLSALVMPVGVHSNALRRDGLLVLATAVALAGVALLLPLDRLVGTAFVASLALYIAYAWYQESTAAPNGHTAAYEKAEAYEELHPRRPAVSNTWSVILALGIALVGLAIIVTGGNILVDGAIGIAERYGISQAVIGLTIVAVGTSLPELVTSAVAAARGHADVAIGNIMGSNIYNVLGIGGVTALISPTVVPDEIARFDIFVMIAASVALLVFARTGLTIHRWEGAALLGGYGAYLWALWPA